MPDQKTGDIFGKVFLLNKKGGAEICSLDDSEKIRNHPDGIWVHLHYSDTRDIEQLAELFELDEVIVNALEAESTRPRTTPFEDGLLMILRGVNLNAGEDPEDMVSIRLFINESIMLSTSRQKLQSVNDLREQLESGKGATTTSELLVNLVDRLVLRMTDLVDDMEEAVADLEEQIMEGVGQNLRMELGALRRQSTAARRHLAPQREALNRLLNEKVNWMSDADRIDLREINDRLIRHIEDVDEVRDRAAIAHEELNSRHSEQLNSKMYILSVVAAIFLPLGFLTGLLGINVGGIPGSENQNAFWIFIGILTVTVVIQAVIFRWKKWL